MKKKILFGFLLVLCFVPAMVAQNLDDLPNRARYCEQNKEVMKQSQENRKVVFFGNSITELWDRYLPQFFTDNGFVPRGISGQTTAEFLLRFRWDVLMLKPQVVVLNGGTNDIAENLGPYDEDYTYGNLISMVQLAQANGIKVIMTSVLPAEKFGWSPSVTDSMAKIRSLNARLYAYAQEHNIPWVDYFTAMLSPDQKGILEGMSTDGVHPTPEGYAIMEAALMPVLNAVLEDL